MKQILKTVYIISIASLFTACSVANSMPVDIVKPTINSTDVNSTAQSAASTLLAQTRTATSTAVPSATSSPILPLAPTQSFQLFELRSPMTNKWAGPPIYSLDGNWLFLPTIYGIFILDTNSYQAVRLLNIFSESYNNKALSPDGKTFVVGNKLFSVANGLELPYPKILPIIRTVNGNSGLSNISFSSNNALIVVAYYGERLLDVWSVQDGELLYSLRGESVVFSPSNSLLTVTVYLGKEPYVQLYDSRTGSFLGEWAGTRSKFITDNHLAIETNGATRVYDLVSGKAPYAFSGKFADFSPDGNLVALLYLNRIEIRQVNDGKLLYSLDGDFNGVDYVDLDFAPNGQTLLGYAYWGYCCGGYDRRLFLWRMDDGSLVKETRGFYSYDFSSDGQLLAVITENGLEIWNAVDGSLKVEINEITIP